MSVTVEQITEQAFRDVYSTMELMKTGTMNFEQRHDTEQWTMLDWSAYSHAVAMIACHAFPKEDGDGEIVVEVLDEGTYVEFDPTFAALQMVTAASRNDAETFYALMPREHKRASEVVAKLLAMAAELTIMKEADQ